MVGGGRGEREGGVLVHEPLMLIATQSAAPPLRPSWEAITSCSGSHPTKPSGANALCPSPPPPPSRSPPLPPAPPPHGGAFQEALNFLMQRIYLSSVMTALRILFGRLMLASGLIGLNQADILL